MLYYYFNFTGIDAICTLVFWVFFSELSFFLSKFTTVGRFGWFGDFAFWLEHHARFTLKLPKVANRVLPASYWKGFVCRPCHTFWLTLAFQYFWGTYWLVALILSLITYNRVKGNGYKLRTNN